MAPNKLSLMPAVITPTTKNIDKKVNILRYL